MPESEDDDRPQSRLTDLEEQFERLRNENLSLRRFVDSMQNLLESLDAPSPDSDVMDTLGEILDRALETTRAKAGSLLVRDDQTDELIFTVSRGEVPPERLTWRRLPPGTGIAGWVVENRKATIVNNAKSDDRFYGDLDTDLEFQTRTILAAPLISGSDVLGLIEVLNKQDGLLFTKDDQTYLSLMCRLAGEMLHTIMQRELIELTQS